jgi:hypothetical protein
MCREYESDDKPGQSPWITSIIDTTVSPYDNTNALILMQVGDLEVAKGEGNTNDVSSLKESPSIILKPQSEEKTLNSSKGTQSLKNISEVDFANEEPENSTIFESESVGNTNLTLCSDMQSFWKDATDSIKDFLKNFVNSLVNFTCSFLTNS